jgi:hypothetical protein
MKNDNNIHVEPAACGCESRLRRAYKPGYVPPHARLRGWAGAGKAGNMQSVCWDGRVRGRRADTALVHEANSKREQQSCTCVDKQGSGCTSQPWHGIRQYASDARSAYNYMRAARCGNAHRGVCTALHCTVQQQPLPPPHTRMRQASNPNSSSSSDRTPGGLYFNRSNAPLMARKPFTD